MKTIKILIITLLLLSPAAASAREVQIGASIPVLAPVTSSAKYGVGLLPRFQVGLTEHLKVSLDAGVLMSSEAGSWAAMEFPVLLGTTWVFGETGNVGRPFIHLLAGYTYARDGIPEMESNHWITVGGGTGVNIQWRKTTFQVGFDLLCPDVRNASVHPVWMAFNLGVHYSLGG